MNKIKVMIVDDSAAVRKVISDILRDAPGIEVIGAAQDPIFAMTRMEKQWPDVIVLDIEMPRMDGLTFLQKIMTEHPTPIVMCSTLTEKGSTTTMKALNYGAVEAIAKPKGNVKTGFEDTARELIDAVKAAAQANLRILKKTIATPREIPPKLTADAVLSKTIKTPKMGHGKIVAIGTSTGGTQALEVVLARLPIEIPGIIVVQHMPEKFTHAFAERLNSVCQVEVKEAANNDPVLPGRVLIAPGGQHMMLQCNGSNPQVVVKDGPLVSRHRPSVDVLFRSVAKCAGKNALGIIMTGMGDDGATGLKEMHDAGALTLGQNKETCVVYGMPAVAAQRGAIDREVALEQIAEEIIAYGKKS